MENDPTGENRSAWAAPRRFADSGELFLTPEIALHCARHVADMLNVIVGVQNWLAQNFAAASPPIANTPSGQQLAAVFHHKIAHELHHRLDQHRGVLTDMGATFVEAGEQYAHTESANAASFGHFVDSLESMSFGDPTGTAPPGSPFVQALPDVGAPNWAGITMQNVAIAPESGQQLTWQQLYAIGQSMDPQAVANAGGVWFWLAQLVLQPAFTDFAHGMAKAADQWSGQGATASINATQQYSAASQALTTEMNQLGELLIYTAGWVQRTQAAMPAQPAPPTTSGNGYATTAADISALTQPFRDAFTTNYTGNFAGSTNNVAVLTSPVAVTSSTGTAGDGLPMPQPDPSVDGGALAQDAAASTAPANSIGSASSAPDSKGAFPASDAAAATPDSGTSATPDSGEFGGAPSASSLANALAPNGSLPFSPAGAAGGRSALAGGRNILANLGGPGSGPGLGLSSAGSGGSGLRAAEQVSNADARLSERPAAPSEEQGLGRAGSAAGQQPGFPLGGARGGKKDEDKQRKHAAFLESTEYLDEAIGAPARTIRPVVDR